MDIHYSSIGHTTLIQKWGFVRPLYDESTYAFDFNNYLKQSVAKLGSE